MLKDSGILTTLGNDAYYIGQMGNAPEYYKELLAIFEELRDVQNVEIVNENIRLITRPKHQ
ncbi:MAG: hypothetical protein CHKLHMKO_00016 [Candidatus Argoarchaeum ethanivorans]|uniref:Uncharacterized protein n=1 Tax=Candidatus Argoarchaeum ethanivorans TaxID=2608793 RepID=A0A811T5L7_9EURY|nr:MAG: hypothetical protein CHKLHMKO_00016 [Candidatus Argoarchaeum ethanivorans]